MSPPAVVICLAIGLLAAGAGCQSVQHGRKPVVDSAEPRELKKVTMPEYVIEPPDVVQIDLVNAVPKSPYIIRTLDALGIRAQDALPESPIGGSYAVDPDGTVNFGTPYGTVKVVGLTIEGAKTAIEKSLKAHIKMPVIDVSLAQTRGSEQVRGPHLVRPDGSVGLGTYGSVKLVGLPMSEAKAALEGHLGQFFEKPEISLEITGYNSKVYYVVFDGGGAGQQLSRVPSTGNETVLDAISQLSGLPGVADAKRIWISRPTGASCPCQTLDVDWKAITECGDPRTNYQILPGDRLFVNSYRLTKFETVLSRTLAPVERVVGFSLLGAGAVRTLRFQGNNGTTTGNNVNNLGFGGGF